MWRLTFSARVSRLQSRMSRLSSGAASDVYHVFASHLLGADLRGRVGGGAGRHERVPIPSRPEVVLPLLLWWRHLAASARVSPRQMVGSRHTPRTATRRRLHTRHTVLHTLLRRYRSSGIVTARDKPRRRGGGLAWPSGGWGHPARGEFVGHPVWTRGVMRREDRLPVRGHTLQVRRDLRVGESLNARNYERDHERSITSGSKMSYQHRHLSDTSMGQPWTRTGRLGTVCQVNALLITVKAGWTLNKGHQTHMEGDAMVFVPWQQLRFAADVPACCPIIQHPHVD